MKIFYNRGDCSGTVNLRTEITGRELTSFYQTVALQSTDFLQTPYLES